MHTFVCLDSFDIYRCVSRENFSRMDFPAQRNCQKKHGSFIFLLIILFIINKSVHNRKASQSQSQSSQSQNSKSFKYICMCSNIKENTHSKFSSHCAAQEPGEECRGGGDSKRALPQPRFVRKPLFLETCLYFI